MSDTKKLKQIKTSALSRSLSLAKLGLSAGIKYASTKITNSPLDEFLNSQAVQLTKELGQLKGSAMKAGQMLSMYGEHFLPPEANKVLKTLQSDSPPVDWEVMKKYLDTYLEKTLLDELEIQTEPIGSASMGQVYLAVIKSTGAKIALKIQYPNVEKAIDSDVAAIKRILSLAKILPSGIDTTGIFEEIKTMLRQELDYVSEAKLTEDYAKLIGDDTRFIVPKVFQRYCTNKVLATEYIEGLKADHPIVQNLSQARKNKLAENFLDLYFKELFLWRLIQTDPHLGNYKIQLDSKGLDRIVLLDFGATKLFSNDFLSHYKKMIKGAIDNDDDSFFAGATGLGFINKTDTDEYVQVFKKFCHETVEPFWDYNDIRNVAKKVKPDGTYNWKANDLPTRVVKSAFQFRKFDLRTPPQDLLFLDRKTAGVFMFLNSLNAEINARKIISPYFDTL